MEHTNHFPYLQALLQTTPVLSPLESVLSLCTQTVIEAYQAGKKVLVCGNGGSASDSEHIVGELLKGFLKKRPLPPSDIAQIDQICGHSFASSLQQSLGAVSLVSQSAILTAVINDLGADVMYAQQVLGLCEAGDVCIGISTSGNAVNVQRALAVAKFKGAVTIALTGEKESKLSALADLCIQVPSALTPRIQEYHIQVYHALCADVEAFFFEQ